VAISAANFKEPAVDADTSPPPSLTVDRSAAFSLRAGEALEIRGIHREGDAA
jgi:hypothetical protein